MAGTQEQTERVPGNVWDTRVIAAGQTPFFGKSVDVGNLNETNLNVRGRLNGSGATFIVGILWAEIAGVYSIPKKGIVTLTLAINGKPWVSCTLGQAINGFRMPVPAPIRHGVKCDQCEVAVDVHGIPEVEFFRLRVGLTGVNVWRESMRDEKPTKGLSVVP